MPIKRRANTNLSGLNYKQRRKSGGKTSWISERLGTTYHKHVQEKLPKQSAFNYLEACLPHILIPRHCVQHIMSNQPKLRFCCRKLERATADNLEYMTPTFPPPPRPQLHTGPRGLAQLRTLLHAKRTRPPRAQHNTHGGPGARARTSVADNSHPVIFDCGPLMLGQRHLTHSSVGLGPPGATLPPATGCQRVTSALQNKHRNLSARDSGGGKTS